MKEEIIHKIFTANTYFWQGCSTKSFTDNKGLENSFFWNMKSKRKNLRLQTSAKQSPQNGTHPAKKSP